MEKYCSDDAQKQSPYFQITETKNLGQDGLLKAYAQRQASGNPYDVNAKKIKYIGPDVVARSLANSIPETERKLIKVLDVGAGTGLVAEKLRAVGFRYIDALEPSTDLLKDAREKQLYDEYHEIFLTGEHCGIATDSYDAITCCGCLLENHLPIEALCEMIRLVKQGGIIVISGRSNILEKVDAYKDRLIPYMERLERDGKWLKKSEEKIPNFISNYDGILWKYQVV